jgi:hypothetical protein
MTGQTDGQEGLHRVRDALFDVCRRAQTLAVRVERVEDAYSHHRGSFNPLHFYVPSSMNTGRELDDPLEEEHVPVNAQRPRREAIKATLELRAAIDDAIEAVAVIRPLVDGVGESMHRRWTVRTIGQLRLLRGAILKGHTSDFFPSALPMIRSDVPKELRSRATPIYRRMEEIKSALADGIGRKSESEPSVPALLGVPEASGSAQFSSEPTPPEPVNAASAPPLPGAASPDALAPVPALLGVPQACGSAQSSSEPTPPEPVNAASAPPLPGPASPDALAPSDRPPDEPMERGLRASDRRVLKAMGKFNPGDLLVTEVIAEATADPNAESPLPPLGNETTRKCVLRLIELGLAERSEGSRSGARLTMSGRRRLVKIAD